MPVHIGTKLSKKRKSGGKLKNKFTDATGRAKSTQDDSIVRRPGRIPFIPIARA